MKEKTKKPRKPRKPIVRWRGVMADGSRLVRGMVLAALVVASAALTFTQMGFTGIGFGGEYTAYAIVLLQPVALAALLLGTLAGMSVGLFAGVVLYAHAVTMPLSYYELAFVTPVTSIVMLAVSGLLLGLLFAFVLRNDPRGVRRVVYIAIVCVVVSWLYSLGFAMNVIMSLIVDMVTSGIAELPDAQMSEALQAEATRVAMRLGEVDLQAWVDAVLMALFGSLGDFAARRGLAVGKDVGLRALFGVWLSVVVLIAFMVVAPVSFIGITNNEQAEAARVMDDELTYVSTQLEQAAARIRSMGDFMDRAGIDFTNLDDEGLDSAINAMEYSSLLAGYDVESDGLMVVSVDDTVFMCDDGRVEFGDSLAEVLGEEASDALEKSIETGEMQRTIYDMDVDTASDDGILNAGRAITTQIAYVMGRSLDTGETVVALRPSSMVFADRASYMGSTTFTALALLVVVFLLTFRLLDRVVGRRIDETNGVLARITGGDLKARVGVDDPREFASFSVGINGMVDSLKGLIAEAETRMDAELATAKAIQESALPRVFPPFPDILRFDVYASMNAAKEVGGDFYDFFLIGEDCTPDAGKLGFLIADVSGKGVPAALFMMKAKTQLRDYMESGMELGEAVENANRQLCDGNDAGMFVTAWAGVLDYATGHVDFVNAGHNPPLLWRKDEWCWLEEKSGLPLGLFDGMPYEAFSVDCEIGDQLLLYTDGVTEAMSVSGELYGEGRLEELAKANYTMHPRELIDAVRRSVAAHAAGAEQSDDITLLALEAGVPPEITATLTVPADVDELPRVNEFIHTELDRRLCPLRAQHQLDIAVEELFVNVAHYAYENADENVPRVARVSYTYSAEPPSVQVDIADDGAPYDPLAKPDAATVDEFDSVADVPIGGLGILMAKNSVDEMRYERVDGSNVISIVKKW